MKTITNEKMHNDLTTSFEEINSITKNKGIESIADKKISISQFVDNMFGSMWKILLVYSVIALIVVVLFSTVFMLTWIPSESMESTLRVGDAVLSSRQHLKTEDISRYDIIIFTPPFDEDSLYIKRVIGLPGETIEVKNGKVYADGVELDNSFTNGPQNRNADGTWVVPEDSYFVLGDNRNNSADSRYWDGEAFVDVDKIHAKALSVIFPLSHARSLDFEIAPEYARRAEYGRNYRT